MGRVRQVLACSGVLDPPDGNAGKHAGAQVRQAMRLSGVARPRVCLMATGVGDARESIERWYARAPLFGEAELSHLALFVQPSVGDARAHLLSQDVIFVGGGSVVNLLAVWRVHRIDAILRECWEAGVVLAGQSAGSLCWHNSGVTDSFSDALDPVDDCLGFIPYSNGVHDDLPDQPRRERFRRLVGEGRLPAGYATQDGVALHYVETQLSEVLSVLPDATASYVTAVGDGEYHDAVIQPRYWLPPI